MIVGMWMTRDVMTIEPGTSIAEAARRMVNRRVRRLPVVEPSAEGPLLVGIVATRDVMHAFPPGVNPFAIGAPALVEGMAAVGQIMTARPVTTMVDAPLEEAARAMRDHGIGSLPVVRHGVLVGLITESDILRAFVETLGGPGTRLSFEIKGEEDAFGLMARAAPRRGLRVLSLITMRHDDKPLCVARLAGEDVDALVEDLWSSGHTVLNVLRRDGERVKE
ncbi:MAG: CBS domain-containing protein [Gemmataceae bacterium]